MSRNGNADESGSELKTVPKQDPPRRDVERGDDEFPREMLQRARSLVTGAESLDDVDVNVSVSEGGLSASTALVRGVLVDALYGRVPVTVPVDVDVGELSIEKDVAVGSTTDSGKVPESAGRAVVGVTLTVDWVTEDVVDVGVRTEVTEQPQIN